MGLTGCNRIWLPRSTITQAKLFAIRRIGATRLSLGVENFDDHILEINGRAHRSPEIAQAYRYARELDFPQINIDLIAGMLGETDSNWQSCVQKTLELEPDSVTIYQMELPFNTTISKDLLKQTGRFSDSMSSEGEYGVFQSEPGADSYLPLSPEKAARFAAATTGARVAEVPVAVMTHPGGLGNVAPAKCMRWRIMLDNPVRLAGEYGEYETREVYVRLKDYCSGEPVLQVVDRQQTAGGWIEYPRFAPNHDIASLQRVNVVFARPLGFDIVNRIP